MKKGELPVQNKMKWNGTVEQTYMLIHSSFPFSLKMEMPQFSNTVPVSITQRNTRLWLQCITKQGPKLHVLWTHGGATCRLKEVMAVGYVSRVECWTTNMKFQELRKYWIKFKQLQFSFWQNGIISQVHVVPDYTVFDGCAIVDNWRVRLQHGS